jgi:hypothetical protein
MLGHGRKKTMALATRNERKVKPFYKKSRRKWKFFEDFFLLEKPHLVLTLIVLNKITKV